ncbi:probable trehalase [Diospyros lotus]|uniref:probable trehalase n=1 Tax=Diospyros lotus TaxID=55363 RepID=UPI002250C419|nr:probable trehalase [Diospyros lotus]
MSKFGSVNPRRIRSNFSLHLPIIFSISMAVIAGAAATSEASPICSMADSGPVVPTTALVSFLERVQDTALYTLGQHHFDPKLYVDLSLKFNLSTTEDAFNRLPRSQNGSVPLREWDGFMKTYMNGAEEDLVYAEPPDFAAEPEGFLPKVAEPAMRTWALEVHSLWKNLSRRVADSVYRNPELHTLLPLPKPVMIPGSRFREVYYWDSYWVIRGLLASKMYETAKGIVTNLISLIDEFGYVLNGARAYYTNRSQPPLLSSMVYDIYHKTSDLDLVREALPALLKEHDFWTSEIHSVVIQDAQGRNRTLSRYHAMWNKPRPESSTIDKETASKLLNDSEKEQLYRELASAAESGWDFSTRWMRNASDLTTLATTSILPVDLNVFILKMELDIAFFANVTGDSVTAEEFLEAAKERQQAMNSVFWNEEMGQWLDYWLISNHTTSQNTSYTWEAVNQNKNVFASNFIPLWIDLFTSDGTRGERVVQSFQSSGLLRAVGIATSLTNTGQQWDFPNGWAPLQHMIVEGLLKYGSKEARSMAEDIAIRWIRTNHDAYKQSGAMHEKYDVEKCGEFGGGGEYVPQTGFVWSNGVVLSFLEDLGWPQDLEVGCQ